MVWSETNGVTDLAFKLLVLPHSNACEGRFSQIALLKNETRIMLNPTLTAILGIRAGLKRIKKDCATYVPSYVKIGSKEVSICPNRRVWRIRQFTAVIFYIFYIQIAKMFWRLIKIYLFILLYIVSLLLT